MKYNMMPSSVGREVKCPVCEEEGDLYFSIEAENEEEHEKLQEILTSTNWLICDNCWGKILGASRGDAFQKSFSERGVEKLRKLVNDL